VMALKCSEFAWASKLGVFYSQMKAEINRLGADIRPFTANEEEWTDALERLKKAKDRRGWKGQKDWLLKADKVALEHAKTLNLPKKNMTAIYYELKGVLVSDEKVDECLEKGVSVGFF